MLRNGRCLIVWCAMVFAMVVGLSLPGMTGAQANAAEIDCDNLETSALVEPAQLREACNFPKDPNPWVSEDLSRAPTDTGYAQDIGFVSDNFVTFTLNDFPNQTVVGTSTNPYYGMDFDAAATTLWALRDDTGELGTIDLATGAFTAVVACPPGGGAASWSGLSIDPATDVFYGCTTTDLYTIDPATGVSTLVGAFGQPGGLMIDIAMNMTGQMYGHDIGDDAIYSIDPATGVATLVGSTGFNANYAQGMDFDNGDGTLYIFLYIGGGANVYGTVDLATGAVTALATDNPQGEFEGGIMVPGGDFEPLVCNGPAVSFEAGVIPDDWSITSIADPLGQWLVSMDNSSSFFTIPATPYGSYYASANDDAAGSGSDGSADYLYSNVFDLTDAAQASLSFGYFFNAAYGQIAGGVQVSPDGGTTWDTEIIVVADAGAWQVHFVDLSAYAGLPAVQVRFHSDDGGNWASGFAVDEIALTCSQPAITLSTVVDTVAGCPGGGYESITVAPGTDVYYCYTMENTGNVAFDMHDLLDDQLGQLILGANQLVNPGETMTYNHPAVAISTTTVNSATWDAYQATGGPNVAAATDGAEVIVSAPAPLVCNGPAVGFDAGIPPDWTVINNVGGNPVEWASIADCGEAGNFTSGAGEGACASSDLQGGGAGLYDTELISPPIDLTGMGIVNISYASNYQNYAGVDFLDLDVSTDGGTTWTTVQSWNEDHPGGGLHTPPGEDVANLDLSAFGNLSGVLIRWHYYDPVGGATSTDWYAQIDNVVLNCVIPVELQSFSVE